MTKHITSLTILLTGGLFLGASCSTPTTTTNTNTVVINNNTTNTTGDWVPDKQGPWDGSIQTATSTDGLNFTATGDVLSEQAGVPNLLQLADGTLVLLYQYFSFVNEAEFDVIAYSTSSDNGSTWSDRAILQFSGLPTPIDADKKPMDPTLVQLPDGRLRLYFTFHAQGNIKPALYSATTADDQLSSTFVVESTPALMSNTANLLDPAVIYYKDQWHHYTWSMESDYNYHSISDDGEQFTMQDDIELPMDFLGQVIVTDDGLRFYGTGKGEIVSASSSDGYTWTMDDGSRERGADPGVLQLSDGSYLMVYTALNFNQ